MDYVQFLGRARVCLPGGPKGETTMATTAENTIPNAQLDAWLEQRLDDLLPQKIAEIETKQSKETFFQYLHEINIDTIPGTRFMYSNFGANLMGYILEQIYQTPFQELIQQKILKPADMHKCKFYLTNGDKRHYANGYDENGELMPHLELEKTFWGADGSLKSTVSDITKYMQFQLDTNNHAVAESHKKIKELSKDYWIAYYWWLIGEEGIDFHIRHDGGTLTARGILMLYPEENIGIYVVTNLIKNDVFENLAKLISNIFEVIKNN